jgi:excisionase family DNA binding protein
MVDGRVKIDKPAALSNAGSPLLDTKRVAALLGVAVRTVSLWAEYGEIPAFKIGRQWRFRQEAIAKWMEALEQASLEVHPPVVNWKEPVQSSYRRGLTAGASAFPRSAR